MDLVHAAYEPEGDGPFATVLALHGWGASALDLLGLAPHLLGGNALLLAPQGPIRIPIGPGVYGFGWFPIRTDGPPDLRAMEGARKSLEEFLEAALDRYPVDPGRLFIVGFSQGGVMAYDLALRRPERFAGIAGLSSWLPEALAREFPKTPWHERLPALVQHGSEDVMIPVSRGRESAEHLRELGLRVTYREYAMGHEISAQSLRDLTHWLAGERLP